MLRVRSILAPYDFSVHADHALEHAAALARLHGARLHVLTVVEVRPVPRFAEDGRLLLYSDEPVTAPAEKALTHRAGQIEGVEAHAHAERGVVGEQVLSFLDRHEVDLLVLSTHGYTGLKGVLMGSVARAIVDSAPCPVLLLKAFGRSLLAPEEKNATAAVSAKGT